MEPRYSEDPAIEWAWSRYWDAVEEAEARGLSDRDSTFLAEEVYREAVEVYRELLPGGLGGNEGSGFIQEDRECTIF